MGIKGLQKYILSSSSSSIAQHFDYKEEIEKWRLDHGCDPTIIIDLKELTNTIPHIFKETLTYGGVFNLYNEMVTYFFSELKKCQVNLVFFMRERIFVGETSTLESQATGDFHSHERRRMRHNTAMIAKQFGELFITQYRNNNFMVNYAMDHADKVLSIIGNDTDFLVYDGKYQYWSIAKWPESDHYPCTRGLRFDRDTLMSDLGFNDKQIRLLATLSDILNWFYFPNKPAFKTFAYRFKCAIDYVKRQTLSSGDSYNWDEIAHDLYGDNCTPEHIERFKDRYEDFDINRRPDNPKDLLGDVSPMMIEVIEFCKKNHFPLMNSLVGCDKQVVLVKDLYHLDKCSPSAKFDFVNAFYSVLLKIPGILYKDEVEDRKPKECRLFIESGDASVEMRDIIYPPDSGITLKQLIVEEDNRAYDEMRWELLQWTMGFDAGFLSTIRSTNAAGKIRVVAIALHFLLLNNLIPAASAKSILYTEIKTRSSNAYTPRHHCPPPKVQVRWPRKIEPGWIHEANKYTIVYWLVCRALEMCGLRTEVDLITFNALGFYEAMVNPNTIWRKSIVEDILFPDHAEI